MKINNGKLLWRDQERNIMIGIFSNKNSKGTKYGKISITQLKGSFIYKHTLDLSLPEFERLKALISRVPEIEAPKKKETKS